MEKLAGRRHFVGKDMFCSSCGVSCVSNAKFCHICGTRINFDVAVNAENTSVELMKEYFHRGYPYNAIVCLLEKHGVRLHVRTLKRKLRELGLKRRGADYEEATVCQLIEQEMQGAGSLAGYRYIWHVLQLRHHIHVPRSLVSSLMKEIDPNGVQDRMARRLSRRNYVSIGPNFTWHIDGTFIFFIKLLMIWVHKSSIHFDFTVLRA